MPTMEFDYGPKTSLFSILNVPVKVSFMVAVILFRSWKPVMIPFQLQVPSPPMNQVDNMGTSFYRLNSMIG